MPFLILLILALAYLQNKWPEPPGWLTPLGSVLLTWLGVVLLVAAAGIMAAQFRYQLARQPQHGGHLLRRHFFRRRLHLIALVSFYFLASYLIGWGWTVKHCLTYGRWTVPGAELLILLPFLAGLFLSWARFYDVELALQNLPAAKDKKEIAPALSRWAYVGLQARQSLILAVPPFLLLLIQQTVFGLFPHLQDDPLLMPLLSGALLALLFVGWPWLLRLLLNLQPLPDCPLRQRLEQTARQLKFRCSNILVWDTHDTLATALLTGPLPSVRYVVLTDRLISQMEPEEVEAVFGHEIGHVKHRHMLFFLLFLAVSLLVLSALWQALLGLLPVGIEQLMLAYLPWPAFWQANRDLLLAGPLLVLLLLYLFVVFGFLSRRCERQADIYAFRAVSAPAFISALEKVAQLNGISRDRPGWLASWRHGTIATRVACLKRLQADPRLEFHYQLNIGLTKWGLLAGLGCVLLALGPDRLWELFLGF